jgi:hypothetical protein
VVLSSPAVDEHRRTFYRIVRTDPPTLRDFQSNAEIGKEPRRPLTRREQSLWRGLSVYGSLEAALASRAKYPRLGGFIARIRVAPDVMIRVEQTGRDPEHYTIWAPALLLLSLVDATFDETV